MEDDDQRIHFKNLSVHRANTEEEALNLVSPGLELQDNGPTIGMSECLHDFLHMSQQKSP